MLFRRKAQKMPRWVAVVSPKKFPDAEHSVTVPLGEHPGREAAEAHFRALHFEIFGEGIRYEIAPEIEGK
jgi:hypothetical protein